MHIYIEYFGRCAKNARWRGGGGYSVGFLGLFGLKTDIDFAHFGLESGMVFKVTTRSVWTYLSSQFKMSKEEREISKLEMDLKNFFLFAL